MKRRNQVIVRFFSSPVLGFLSSVNSLVSFLCVGIALFLCLVTPGYAMDVTLAWDANTDSDLAGYKVYYKTGSSGEPYDGISADQGTSPIIVLIQDLGDPNNPEYTLTGLSDTQVFFFVVTAYDDEGLESDYSNEVPTLLISSPQNGFNVNATNYTSYSISGIAAPFANVEIFAGTTSLGITTALADGTWTIVVDFEAAIEGVVTLTVVSDGTTSNAVTGTYYKSAPAVPTPPQIVETIPHDDAGMNDDTTRVPNDTSFCVRFDDYEGINITDTSSIIFTIDDGVNEIYTRDLSDDTVVRVVKLTEDDDTQVTKLWAVYDRSREGELGNYPYDTNVNIRVDAKERWQEWMPQASYDFNIETSAEHNAAQDNLPDVSEVALDDSDLEDPDYFYDTGVQVVSGELEGAKIIYYSSEPVTPRFGPTDEVPEFNMEEAGSSINLQPSTVFNTPVKIFIPYPDYAADVSDLSIFLYNGTDWVLACDASGNVQPEGEGWMVPGSRVNHNDRNPPIIEIKVHHFSAVQTGSIISLPTPSPDTASSTPDDAAGGGDAGGGCFITTVDYAQHNSLRASVRLRLAPLARTSYVVANVTFANFSLLSVLAAGGLIIVQRLAKKDNV